jgi:putative N6-adenine-specific DNA methylase
MKSTDRGQQRQTRKDAEVTKEMAAPEGQAKGMDDRHHHNHQASVAQLCFAAAAPGFEPWVAQELRELGLASREVEGGAEFQAKIEQLAAIVRHLRVASRVLVRMAEGRVEDPSSVRGLVGRVAWTVLPAHPTRIALRLTAQGAPPDRIRWVQAELLRALCERFGADRVVASAVTEAPDDVALVARLDGRICSLSVDAGGKPLHLRGYRLEAGPAPMRETVAAAMLRAIGFGGHGTVWDPMCGSGTTLIEAALWGRELPRELGDFGVDQWRSKDLSVLSVRGAADPADGAVRLVGGDLDPDVLQIARRNAARAGVAERITWLDAELAAQRFESVEPGFVVTNPPYGQRLGGRNAARRLYERLGAVLARRCGGWRAAVLVPEQELARALPFRDLQLCSVDNGGLKVWLATGELAAGIRRGHARTRRP